MKDIGKALFNLQRFQILQTKLNPATSYQIPDAYAYAWSCKLFPLLDDCDLHEDLQQYFTITRDQVDKITCYADEEWLKKRYYNFYDYESYFRGVESISRYGLISVFRYMYLKGCFDNQFWSKLLEPMKYPSEASVITNDFNVDYLYLI